MLTGTNLTYTKAYNYRIVFEAIRLNNKITRAEIARETTLTAQTISNIVTRLIDANLIIEGEKIQDGRGAPSVALKINPASTFSIGIDFNWDHISGVLVDLAGNIKQQKFISIEDQSPTDSIEMMASLYNDLIKQSTIDKDKLSGVGISFPGPMKVEDSNIINVVSPKSLPNWLDVPIVTLLAKHISEPILIENNATAAAMGEKWFGNAKQLSNYVYLFFGAGLGAGIFIDGQVYNGNKCNAGEIGYFPLSAGSSPLINVDSHIGANFDLERLYKWLKQNDGTLEISNPDQLEKLFDDQHPAFYEWLSASVNILSQSTLYISYIIDPEAIILGGRIPQKILTHFEKHINENLNTLKTEQNIEMPSIECAIAGSNTAALGAATLPMYHMFSPQYDILMKSK
mgnify:FL=1